MAGQHVAQFIDGFPVPVKFSEEAFRSALSYKPRDDDVFIVTFPKCGTTWAQHILALIFRHGEPFDSSFNVFESSPFFEVKGAKAVETMPRPGAIKIHLPFHLAPWSSKAKYIYLTRNPKDCCVSYFHHCKGHDYGGTFSDYFEIFIAGSTHFGDYFDHLVGWYENRNRPNVFFTTYEELKEDPGAVILKMASFIDESLYAEPLRNNREKLDNVIKYSSFDHMKKILTTDMLDKTPPSHTEGTPEKNLTVGTVKEDAKDPKKHKHDPSKLVRKGVIGDWRNYFSEEQSKRMDEKFMEKTKNIPEIQQLWKKYM